MPTVKLTVPRSIARNRTQAQKPCLCSRSVAEPLNKFGVGVASHSEKQLPVSSARQAGLLGDNQTPVGSDSIIYASLYELNICSFVSKSSNCAGWNWFTRMDAVLC